MILTNKINPPKMTRGWVGGGACFQVAVVGDDDMAAVKVKVANTYQAIHVHTCSLSKGSTELDDVDI